MTLRLDLTPERWPLREAFATARDSVEVLPLLHLRLTDGNGTSGHAEAAGVDYDGETVETMAAQLAALAGRLHDDIAPADVQTLLPPGGARNALDCALWDLRAKRSGRPAWQAAGLAEPQALVTAFTIGLADTATVRRRARAASGLPLLKLKLDATRHLALVAAVREEAPVARLVVDANQAWTAALLEKLLPALVEAGVEAIEQPLPRGADAALEGFASPLPIVADESCTTLDSLSVLRTRYQAVNVKLDKSGGLTEALALARAARAAGLDVMVGNMCGSSLGMAPAFLVAQLARWADLDGPLLQATDRRVPMRYAQGHVDPPPAALWG